MLPPSPSTPRSFDSSAYSSPHLQTPSSASSNAGKCVTHPTKHESVWLLSNCYKNGFNVCLPHRAHISWRVSASAGSRKRAAGHESQPGSILGQITVSDRQPMPCGNREEEESVVKGLYYLKQKNTRWHTGNNEAQNRVIEGPWWARPLTALLVHVYKFCFGHTWQTLVILVFT